MYPVVGYATILGVVFIVAALIDGFSGGRGENFDAEEFHRMCSHPTDSDGRFR